MFLLPHILYLLARATLKPHAVQIVMTLSPSPRLRYFLKRLSLPPKLVSQWLLLFPFLVLLFPFLISPTPPVHPSPSPPHVLAMASLAVEDQLHLSMDRLDKDLFMDDYVNQKMLVQFTHFPPLFVSRLGKEGRRKLLRRLTLDSNGVVDFASMPKILVVDLQNGLGNRLRALGSALEFAFYTRRVLVVLWAPDAHTNATMADLFHEDVLDSLIVIEQAVNWPLDPDDVPDNSSIGIMPKGNLDYVTAVSYMQKDRMFKGGSMKSIRNVNGKHMYIKTAYVLQGKIADGNLINAFVQALKPAPAVAELVEQVESNEHLEGMVGVHIRARTIKNDNEKVDHECEYSVEGAKVTDRWREMSGLRQFIPEMRKMRSDWRHVVRRSYAMVESGEEHGNAEGRVIIDLEKPPKFYVAADSVETLTALEKEFGPEEIVYLPRSCDDRGSECLLYAFADLIILSRTGAFLASGWSSFSEAASRMRKRFKGVDPNRSDGYVIRTSGIDFGTPSNWDWVVMQVGSIFRWTKTEANHRKGISQAEMRKRCEGRRRVGDENKKT